MKGEVIGIYLNNQLGTKRLIVLRSDKNPSFPSHQSLEDGCRNESSRLFIRVRLVIRVFGYLQGKTRKRRGKVR